MKPRKHGAPHPGGSQPAETGRTEPSAGAERAPAEPGATTEPASVSAPDPVLEELTRLRAREDELLRAVAESQNVLRRRKQEMDASVRHAEEAVVRDLLPVLDDLDRALGAMAESADPSIRTGVALVRDRLVGLLEQRGLQSIRPQGEPFDPELHDALAQRPSTAPPGSVLEVIQPGYRFRDRVLRHAKVIVAGVAEPEESGTASPAGRTE